MPKIDFKHFKMFTSITRESSQEVDVTLVFSDLLYKKVNGIVAHDLALRIYKSEGPVEFTKEEVDSIKEFVSENFTPAFIDSFDANTTE